MPTLRRRLLIFTAPLAIGAALLVQAPAQAHVTASSDNPTQGGYSIVTFTVPTESSTAQTTRIDVELPTDHPLTAVRAEPVPGWNVVVERGSLPAPTQDANGNTLTEAPLRVTWTATGAGIAPNEFQRFAISAGPLPNVDTVYLPAVQTYSDGTEVKWVEQTAADAKAQYPAPSLALAASDTVTDAHGDVVSAHAEGSATADAASASAGISSDWPLGPTFIAAFAALAAAAALVLALRRRAPADR